jgi:hypothetical protein
MRGNSSFDVRQVFNAAVNYTVPASNLNSSVAALTKHWSVDARFAVNSGYPLSVFQGEYLLPTGSTQYILPDLVHGQPVYLHNIPSVLGGWELNKAAFATVPLNPDGSPARQGDSGRNQFHGPNFWNVNASFQREFAIRESLHLIFRTDAFNLLNHPNAGDITTCLSCSTFGQSAGRVGTLGVPNPLYATGSARSLQLMLKLQL